MGKGREGKGNVIVTGTEVLQLAPLEGAKFVTVPVIFFSILNVEPLSIR
jgi:hypothetical protein